MNQVLEAEAPRISLAPRLTGAAAAELDAALRNHRGEDIVVEAGRVELLGAQCAQVLVSAMQTWRIDGARLSVEAPSAAFAADFRRLGLGREAAALEAAG
ncbi:MAG: STAS domain-containing protein [Pseudomonadota bacterium]